MKMQHAEFNNALIRTSTKKLFRKWKPARLVLFSDRIVVHFDDKAEPLIVRLEPSMKLSNVFEQRQGSLTETRVKVFFCRLVRETVGGVGDSMKKSQIGASSFLDELETESVLKFGCESMDDLVAFAKLLDKMLTTSDSWESFGRHRAGSKTDVDEQVRDVGRRYRNSTATSPPPSPQITLRSTPLNHAGEPKPDDEGRLAQKAIDQGSHPSTQSNSQTVSPSQTWERFEFQDVFS